MFHVAIPAVALNGPTASGKTAVAVEVARLRLFLKLASAISDPNKIEPLPDLDFNIKAGNMLVGARIPDEIDIASDGLLIVDDNAGTTANRGKWLRCRRNSAGGGQYMQCLFSWARHIEAIVRHWVARCIAIASHGQISSNRSSATPTQTGKRSGLSRYAAAASAYLSVAGSTRKYVGSRSGCASRAWLRVHANIPCLQLLCPSD